MSKSTDKDRERGINIVTINIRELQGQDKHVGNWQEKLKS